METRVMEAHDALAVLNAEDAEKGAGEVPVAAMPEAVTKAIKSHVVNGRVKSVVRQVRRRRAAHVPTSESRSLPGSA